MGSRGGHHSPPPQEPLGSPEPSGVCVVDVSAGGEASARRRPPRTRGHCGHPRQSSDLSAGRAPARLAQTNGACWAGSRAGGPSPSSSPQCARTRPSWAGGGGTGRGRGCTPGRGSLHVRHGSVPETAHRTGKPCLLSLVRSRHLVLIQVAPGSPRRRRGRALTQKFPHVSQRGVPGPFARGVPLGQLMRLLPRVGLLSD